MLKIRYVPVGKSTKEELEGLYKLLEQEGMIKIYKNVSFDIVPKSAKKILKFYKWNHKPNEGFRLVDMGIYGAENYVEMKDNYNFIYVKDRKNRVLAYLCFATNKLVEPTENGIDTIYIIKHMYISNELSHLREYKRNMELWFEMANYRYALSLDYLLIYMLENLSDACIIYSDIMYGPINDLNGYKYIGTSSMLKEESLSGIKIKEKNKESFIYKFAKGRM